MRLIAILGGSGSGKSQLGLELAQKHSCEIFSLDSLSIYQEIDIASAKPTKEELESVTHYGVNILSPTEHNNALVFDTLLKDTITKTQSRGKDTLLIIGGSSFYLKAIIEGLSPLPKLSNQKQKEIEEQISSLSNPLEFLLSIEPNLPFSHQDSYRIRKYLEIYFSTNLAPSIYFKQNPKIPFAYPIEKYALVLDREVLRERIAIRTQKMDELGLLDEAQRLLQKYGNEIQPFSSIGLKECKEYFEGKISSKEELLSLISTHTAQLAKRQSTFNRTQFGIPKEISSCTSPREYATEHIIQGDYASLLKSI